MNEVDFDRLSYRVTNLYEVEDSKIRLDQEQAIHDDLESGHHVLVRGTWRLGQSSLLKSLITHRYPNPSQSLWISCKSQIPKKGIPVSKFPLWFGMENVTDYIARHNVKEGDYRAIFKESDNIERHIKENKKEPLEVLHRFAEDQKVDILLAFDEVIRYAEEGDLAGILPYIAGLSRNPRFKVASIFQRVHRYEDRLSNTFNGFKSHWVRAITVEETHELVKDSTQGAPIEFSNEAIGEIREFSGGRPLEVGYLLSMLFGERSRLQNRKLSYNADDIRAVREAPLWDFISEGVGHVVHSNHARVFYICFSSEERALLERMAKDSQTEVDLGMVRELFKTTYIQCEGSKFKLGGDLFRGAVLYGDKLMSFRLLKEEMRKARKL